MAKISAQLVQPLQIMAGSYSFTLPVAFHPDYEKLGADTEPYPYLFTYSVLIKSTKQIT